MPRIQPVSLEEATGDTRALMERYITQYGQVYPSAGIYAHAPTIQNGTAALDEGITRTGRIPAQLRRLMNARIAQIVGCPF
jgi:hypothetical protein